MAVLGARVEGADVHGARHLSSLLASRLWRQEAGFSVLKVAVGDGDTKFLVGN